MKSSLKEVHVTDAVGMVLAHDLTQVLPGKFKGPLFCKGHVIQKEDIEGLLSIGKEHIYVMELAPGELHENEAANRIARAAAGERVTVTEPREGKVNLVSNIHGLLEVDASRVHAVNQVEQAVISTLESDRPVQEGEVVAASRVIPLIYPEERVQSVEKILTTSENPVVDVLPYQTLKVGVVITGSEIIQGRIPDRFGPVIQEKLQRFGSTVMGQTLAGDDKEMIQAQIHSFIEREADMVLVTGGMSVDPDDRTPGAIQSLGAEIVSYGTPMLPGSMLMVAYYQGIPVLGLPGCVIHDSYTSFDKLLPRILAGKKIYREDIVHLGYGGLHSC